MRIIILGGTGMLGHKLWEQIPRFFPDTYTTIKYGRNEYKNSNAYDSERVIENVDVNNRQLLTGVLKAIKPEIVLNCIGLTIRKQDPHNFIPSICLNALFPHTLAAIACELGAKVINFSTDCVFDGKTGNYRDEIPPTATDLYGRTKALGEISEGNVLTLRSSFIGYEREKGTELLEWFLAQQGTIRGFKNAIYTGLTTLELSRVIAYLLRKYPTATGLYNLSSDPISKFDLLTLIKRKMNRDVEILPEEQFHCDRSLDSTRFRNEFDYTPPSWESMVEELSQKYEGEK
jgi:dTDP-4-dehydrorhamnose reductase